MRNEGVIEGVVRFDADEYSTKDGGVIGRVKVDHDHEGYDKKSQFVVKGFGPFGQQVADLVAGQKVKVKYELTEERWQDKNDEWQREVSLKVTGLQAEEPPADAFDEANDSDGDDDIPF